MAKEIERKFLVDLDRCPLPPLGQAIKQGYIPTVGKTVVRIRLKGDAAFLTLKGANTGASRTEFEYAIPVVDAEDMLAEFCAGAKVEKVRYEIPVGTHLWEIDIFAGDNQGLCVAEVELQAEDEAVDLPPWIVREVTGDPRYYNSNLLTHPYCQWGTTEGSSGQ